MAKRILIVDDTAFMRKMLADSLTQNGYAIAGEASNGREAIRLYVELKPDLVVMDINMPEMGGIEAVRELIKSDPEAVILVCTAASQQEQIHEAMREGAKGYILKPFKMTRVLELIDKHANSREVREKEKPGEQVAEEQRDQAEESVRVDAQLNEQAEGQAQAEGQMQEQVQEPRQDGLATSEGIPAAEQNIPTVSRETREEDTGSQVRSGKVAPLRRRDRVISFVSSVMCHWQEERDGETATYNVVCTESENKVMVELSGTGQTKMTMQFSLDGLLQLSNWLEDHLDRTGTGMSRGIGS